MVFAKLTGDETDTIEKRMDILCQGFRRYLPEEEIKQIVSDFLAELNPVPFDVEKDRVSFLKDLYNLQVINIAKKLTNFLIIKAKEHICQKNRETCKITA
jgi:hypothetical protein